MSRFRLVGISSSFALAFTSAVNAQTVSLVTVDSNEVQANTGTFLSSVSADGRYIAFVTGATNLVASDTNGHNDVFLRDRIAGTTILVSVSSSGVQGNDDSGGSVEWPAVSADGRYVAFVSQANNLIAGDTNGHTDIFLRDTVAGTTECMSVSSSGVLALNHSNTPDISSDGRYVLFRSRAQNLVPNDTNGGEGWDIFLRDRQAGTTTRLDVDANGVESNLACTHPSMSPDARFVTYSSLGNNLVPNDFNAAMDVFFLDRQTGVTERVSVDSNGVEGNGDSTASFGTGVSADGRFVVFTSTATNLVAGDTNGTEDAFVHDRLLGTTTLVSKSSAGTLSNGESRYASISADGRWVVFRSQGSNMVIGDANGFGDVFLHDLTTNTTELASLDSDDGQSAGGSAYPSISADGRFVTFFASADDLALGDANGTTDIVIRERCGTVKSYCTAGLTTNGCNATLSATGLPSASAGSGFTLTASNVEGQKAGLLFYGINGRNDVPWGAGSSSFLCVTFPVQRTPTQNSGGTSNACDGSISIDWNAYIAANPGALGNPFPYAQKVDAQVWFRDPPAPKTTNLSNGIEFTVCP